MEQGVAKGENGGMRERMKDEGGRRKEEG